MHAAAQPLSHQDILPLADWADCYQADFYEGGLSALNAAYRLLENPPAWIDFLMRLRNCIVSLANLRPVEVAVGDGVGGFPVVTSRDSQVVLGFDDSHLNFRIVVEVGATTLGQTVSVTTLVQRKTLFGRLYLFVIMPFHKRIVIASLSGFCRNPRPRKLP
jgi:hypothetical protein